MNYQNSPELRSLNVGMIARLVDNSNTGGVSLETNNQFLIDKPANSGNELITVEDDVDNDEEPEIIDVCEKKPLTLDEVLQELEKLDAFARFCAHSHFLDNSAQICKDVVYSLVEQSVQRSENSGINTGVSLVSKHAASSMIDPVNKEVQIHNASVEPSSDASTNNCDDNSGSNAETSAKSGDNSKSDSNEKKLVVGLKLRNISDMLHNKPSKDTNNDENVERASCLDQKGYLSTQTAALQPPPNHENVFLIKQHTITPSSDVILSNMKTKQVVQNVDRNFCNENGFWIQSSKIANGTNNSKRKQVLYPKSNDNVEIIMGDIVHNGTEKGKRKITDHQTDNITKRQKICDNSINIVSGSINYYSDSLVRVNREQQLIVPQNMEQLFKLPSTGEKVTNFDCIYCKKPPIRPNRSELYRHYSVKHHFYDIEKYVRQYYPGSYNSLVCPVCDKKLKDKSCLINHVGQVHSVVQFFIPQWARISKGEASTITLNLKKDQSTGLVTSIPLASASSKHYL